MEKYKLEKPVVRPDQWIIEEVYEATEVDEVVKYLEQELQKTRTALAEKDKKMRDFAGRVFKSLSEYVSFLHDYEGLLQTAPDDSNEAKQLLEEAKKLSEGQESDKKNI